MAKAKFLFQAVTKENHVTALVDMLATPEASKCIISVAFARTAGIRHLQTALKSLPFRPKVFVGIRNDITWIQAVEALLDLEVDLYTVDTGSRRPIFHPKCYMVASETHASVLIGSANLTHYGLQNNIEASALLDLDLKSANDDLFLAEIVNSLEQMITDYPDHVQHLATLAQAQKLFDDGRLCDEDVIVAPSSAQQPSKGGGTQMKRMKLHHGSAPPKLSVSNGINAPKTGTITKTQFVRVWRSKPLSPRDLSVPEGKNTNLTGSIGLKQDVTADFDFQTYFRKTIFKELTWKKRTATPYKEEAKASFQFLIENIDYGAYELKIAHDTRTDTASYLQRNFMTQLHWGAARPVIARPDLVGRNLSMYKKSSKPPSFLIEID